MVRNFFETSKMLNVWNRTSLTLIPKINNACHVDDFRPIACCSVFYKVVSKILTTRLQNVIHKFVDEAWVGFILGRFISDNKLLAIIGNTTSQNV